ncbi:MAG: uracil-DNA glycosylase [Rhodothermia bacterium]
MSDLTRDARRIIEDQVAIAGGFLPLPDSPPKPESTVHVLPDAESASDITEPSVDTETCWNRLLNLIPSDSPLHELTTLEQIAQYVAGSVLVPIDEARINPVPGVGNPNADIMVIGEAPGADEDEKGEPFVGRAGQLLDKILAAVDFARDEVFIANILKSRPPQNRDPKPDEIEAHLPILLRQITIVRPRLLLCVGRVAGNVITGQNTTLKELRRQNFHDFHGIPLMVTYHPAALLRFGQYKRPTWEDVQALRSRYDELVNPNV